MIKKGALYGAPFFISIASQEPLRKMRAEMNVKEGDQVVLKTFRGRTNAPRKTLSGENYWRLIGSGGVIVQDPAQHSLFADFSEEKRVLVKFHASCADLGLISHNAMANALWILVDDLEVAPKGS